MLSVRFPLSLRNVEDLLFERGYDLCHEKVRLWWNRFGPMFAGEIRRKRINRCCQSNGGGLSRSGSGDTLAKTVLLVFKRMASFVPQVESVLQRILSRPITKEPGSG